jgi:predicted aspartyl protease
VHLIDIEIEEEIIKDVIFDLGYNGGLVVPKKYASKFQSDKTQLFIDQSTSGIFGSNRDTMVVKELKVKISDFNTTIPVQFSSLNKALFGNDFLEHFTIYLNNEDDKIILEPITSDQLEKNRNFVVGI